MVALVIHSMEKCSKQGTINTKSANIFYQKTPQCILHRGLICYAAPAASTQRRRLIFLDEVAFNLVVKKLMNWKTITQKMKRKS